MTCIRLCIQAMTTWYAHSCCRAPLSTRVLTQVLSEDRSQYCVFSVSECMYVCMYCVYETLGMQSDHACSPRVQRARIVISTAILSIAAGAFVCVCVCVCTVQKESLLCICMLFIAVIALQRCRNNDTI